MEDILKAQGNTVMQENPLSPLLSSQVSITKRKIPKQKVPKEKLAFGGAFTDHMLVIDWVGPAISGKTDSLNQPIPSFSGWGQPRILPYGPLELSPSCNVFHYGVEVFEGMKAYKGKDRTIRLFRPLENMKRLLGSARRITLPEFDIMEMLEAIKKLVLLDSNWIPEGRGYSLYIRPTIISTQDTLGVGTTNRALAFAICSPVGPYYSTGFKAVSLKAETDFVRAWPGGTGNHKLGGNYAPGIFPQLLANTEGFQQVLWMMGKDEMQVMEVGTMNLFCFWVNGEKGTLELVTPILDGTILPGITRSSIIELVKSMPKILGQGDSIYVVERPLYMREISMAVKDGRMREMFGSGTAAIISPIKSISWLNPATESHELLTLPLDPMDPSQESGPLARALLKTIYDIQYGDLQFKDWSVVIGNY